MIQRGPKLDTSHFSLFDLEGIMELDYPAMRTGFGLDEDDAACVQYILTLICPDRRGIVKSVAGFLNDIGCNILESAQFYDVESGLFFMRIHFASEVQHISAASFSDSFAELGRELNMTWQVHDAKRKTRVMLLVSKIGHCLNDLLFRVKSGQLPVEVAAIVSNHKDFHDLAASYAIAYHHLPLPAGASSEDRRRQEAKILQLAEGSGVELLVLARYMQVLTPEFCQRLHGRIINIHHSFLPSFKGAQPYHQAYRRGVKLIGATAHFVTGDLDEGPIIDQDVARADHTMTPAELTALGCDAECAVLARAVRWFAEHRIALNEQRTVIFR